MSQSWTLCTAFGTGHAPNPLALPLYVRLASAWWIDASGRFQFVEMDPPYEAKTVPHSAITKIQTKKLSHAEMVLKWDLVQFTGQDLKAVVLTDAAEVPILWALPSGAPSLQVGDDFQFTLLLDKEILLSLSGLFADSHLAEFVMPKIKAPHGFTTSHVLLTTEKEVKKVKQWKFKIQIKGYCPFCLSEVSTVEAPSALLGQLAQCLTCSNTVLSMGLVEEGTPDSEHAHGYLKLHSKLPASDVVWVESSAVFSKHLTQDEPPVNARVRLTLPASPKSGGISSGAAVGLLLWGGVYTGTVEAVVSRGPFRLVHTRLIERRLAGNGFSVSGSNKALAHALKKLSAALGSAQPVVTAMGASCDKLGDVLKEILPEKHAPLDEKEIPKYVKYDPLTGEMSSISLPTPSPEALLKSVKTSLKLGLSLHFAPMFNQFVANTAGSHHLTFGVDALLNLLVHFGIPAPAQQVYNMTKHQHVEAPTVLNADGAKLSIADLAREYFLSNLFQGVSIPKSVHQLGVLFWEHDHSHIGG